MLFILYSNFGWLIEVIKTKFDDKKWVNRGFLIGPYLPIYGISAIVMVNYLTHYKGDIVTVFILALFICSFVIGCSIVSLYAHKEICFPLPLVPYF